MLDLLKTKTDGVVCYSSLTRDEATSKFLDSDLAAILQTATETPAAAFRALGTPASARILEIAALEQAREQGVCSFNDFRKLLGLPRMLPTGVCGSFSALCGESVDEAPLLAECM